MAMNSGAGMRLLLKAAFRLTDIVGHNSGAGMRLLLKAVALEH